MSLLFNLYSYFLENIDGSWDPKGMKNWREEMLFLLGYIVLKKTKNIIKLLSYINKNYRNGGVWQSGISKSLAEYVQRPVCFVNVQSSLHENVVFSVCALMDNAA